MSHKFIYENNYDGQLPCKVEFEFGQDASLTDMLEQFTYYLKACGFHIEEGHIVDIVPEDGYGSEGWDTFFNKEESTTEDFNPRDDTNIFERPSPYTVTFPDSYDDVTITFNGQKVE